MPHVDDPSIKGNLIVEFEIEFPQTLGLESKDFLRKALLINPNQIVSKKESAPKIQKPKAKLNDDDDFYED
jgi:hypothetical protein